MKVGGQGLNLFYTGSHQDLKAVVTNSAQTLHNSNSTNIFYIICMSKPYRTNTNLSMFKEISTARCQVIESSLK